MATTNINGTIIAIGDAMQYDYFCLENRVPITVETMGTKKIVRIPAEPCAYPYYFLRATGADIKQAHPEVVLSGNEQVEDDVLYACIWGVYVYPAVGDEVEIERDYENIVIRIMKPAEDRQPVILADLPLMDEGRMSLNDVLEDFKGGA